MEVTYNISLYLSTNRSSLPLFKAVQSDTDTRKIVATLFDDAGSAYTPEAGVTAEYWSRKPDGHGTSHSATLSGNKVTVTLTAQDLAVSGNVYAAIHLKKGSTLLTAMPFYFEVVRNAIGDSVESSDSYQSIVEATEAAEQATQATQAAIADAEAATSAAQTATQNANTATTNANNATSLANVAAERANDVASYQFKAFDTDEASGSIATFHDGADGIPLKRAEFEIEPKQSGTGDPSPDNVRPISGYTGMTVHRTGKNLLGTLTNGKYIDASGAEVSSSTWSCTDFIKVEEKSYITITGCTNKFGTAPSYAFYDINKTLISAVHPTLSHFTVAIPANAVWFRTSLATSDAPTAMIEFGDAETEYEQTNSATIPITFPTEAGTVYDGNVVINEDGSGVLTVDRALVNISAVTASMQTSGETTIIRLTVSDKENSKGNLLYADRYICSDHAVSSLANAVTTLNNLGDGSCAASINTGSPYVYILDTRYSDVSSWKTANADCMIAYQLATPITYNLTAQQITSLLGTNNVWCDTGDTSVIYRIDPKVINDEFSEDISSLKEGLEAIEVNKADVIINSASGAVASFTDGADGLPIKSLTFGIEPIQSGSGDPSPDNVRPISGWTAIEGALAKFNIWDEVWEAGTIAQADGMDSDSTSRYRSTNFICVVPGQTYYFRSNGATLGLRYYNNQKQYVGYATAKDKAVTLPDDCCYLRIVNTNSPSYSNDVCINFSDTSKNGQYEPYSGQSISITLPTEAGTVYGGTVKINEDGTGVLTVDRALVTIDDSTALVQNGSNVIYMLVPTDLRGYCIPVSNQFVGIEPGVSSELTAGQCRLTVNRMNINFKFSADKTVAEWKTELASNPCQVVFKMNTPQTYDLTVDQATTLLGVNNIWCNTGDTEVEYRADTKLYIDGLIGTTDDDYTADQNIASGQFFSIGNHLYRATSAIASGATIVPGTNCVETNIAEQLTALYASLT